MFPLYQPKLINLIHAAVKSIQSVLVPNPHTPVQSALYKKLQIQANEISSTVPFNPYYALT